MKRLLRWCLGDTAKRRARILEALAKGPVSTLDLSSDLGAWIYFVCREMEDEGLLTSFRAGPTIPVRWNRQRRFYKRADDVLANVKVAR